MHVRCHLFLGDGARAERNGGMFEQLRLLRLEDVQGLHYAMLDVEKKRLRNHLSHVCRKQSCSLNVIHLQHSERCLAVSDVVRGGSGC